MTPQLRIVAFAFAFLTGTGFGQAQTVSAQKTVGKPLQVSPSAATTSTRAAAARPARRVAAPKAAARPTPKVVGKQSRAKPVIAARKVIARKPVVARKAPIKPARSVSVRPTAPAAVVAREPVSLTPGERSVLYRTIVREQIVPAPVITERISPSAGEPASAPVVAGPQPTGPIAPQRVTTAATYAVGAQLPANVPLFAIPESAALQVPVVRRYSYAFINDRVLLVEPFTGIVVAELDR